MKWKLRIVYASKTASRIRKIWSGTWFCLSEIDWFVGLDCCCLLIGAQNWRYLRTKSIFVDS